MEHLPVATYRIQFNSEFTFSHLSEIADYLKALGISTIYASPIFSATKGSTHGYDVINPHRINPEIGTLEEFRVIREQLDRNGISWLQDIVPNHMAFSGSNIWLQDIMQRGKISPFYSHFDIIENHSDPRFRGKIMVPFLGKTVEELVDENEINVSFNENSGFMLNFPGDAYPLSTESLPVLFNEEETDTSLLRLISEFTDEAKKENDINSWSAKRTSLLEKISAHSVAFESALKTFNSDKAKILKLCNSQHFILTVWNETHHTINFRRFFTVNALICLAMEKQQTFEDYHSFILQLTREGLFNGLRIDHIDGLKDPGKYIRQLKKELGPGSYLIIEKILTEKENLPKTWDLEGTSGYEFLSFVNQLLTDKKGAEELLDFYKKFTGENKSYNDIVYDSKYTFLFKYMQGELDNLTNLYIDSGLAPQKSSFQKIKNALALFMCSMPVYRIYPEKYPLEEDEQMVIEETYKTMISKAPELGEEIPALFSLFHDEGTDESMQNKKIAFIQRLMQFTGPLTAKGVEDTTFYNYNPLISHNEVGDSPGVLGEEAEIFHERMLYRQANHPHSLNTTSTHDTKRGEDSRMRINLLSEYSTEWKEHVLQWSKENNEFKTEIQGSPAPSLNDEYFIYQVLLGGYPDDLRVSERFINRMKEYITKALREAKTNTDWDVPDLDYENACHKFIEHLLDEKNIFLKSFKPFLKKLLAHAAIYSLNQTIIKLTAPGIPDIYQGTELWDLSFVDPDNRSSVDYQYRIDSLQELSELESKSSPEELFARLRDKRNCGIEKIFLIKTVLKLRNEYADVFNGGEYIPVYGSAQSSSIIAFCRKYGNTWIMVICPLQLVKRLGDGSWNLAHAYNDVTISLPSGSPRRWTNRITGEVIQTDASLNVGMALNIFPVALLVGKD